MKISETDIQAIEAESQTKPVVCRIWRESFGCWWAEVWVERTAAHPPRPPRAFERFDRPASIIGYVRADLDIAGTRRSAIRKARNMEKKILCPLRQRRPEAEYLA